MKLYLHGHDYKYAAEQMLLVPHGSRASLIRVISKKYV